EARGRAADAPHERADGALELPALGAAECQRLPRAVDAAPRDPRRGAGSADDDEGGERPPRAPHDQHGNEHDGPELGEARDCEHRPASVLMSTANERDPETGETYRQQVEPEIDERVHEEPDAEADICAAGAP